MVWAAKSGLQALCIFRLLRVSKLCEHRTKAFFDQKLIVGGDQRKVVPDYSGFRAYCVDVDWGLNFLSALELAKKWREVYEVVYVIRGEREGESWFKKFTSAMFHTIIYSITDVKMPVDTGDFRLMDRKVVDVLKLMQERHRFPRGMSAWVGFKQIGVTYKRAARVAGVTKYPFSKMLKLD